MELLPDYVLGALSDDEQRRVAQHLDECARCRAELEHLLETASLLAPVVRPSPRAKSALLARVRAQEASAPVVLRSVEEPPEAAVPPAPLAVPETGRHASGRRFWPARAARLALAVVLLAAVVSLGLWNLALQRQLERRDPVAALLADPAAAHPLTDSQLGTGAVGIIYTDPASEVALLRAYGLPPLPADQRYAIWLFTESGERIGAGSFAVGADGNAQVLVRAPAPFAQYWAVGVSAEPAGGSPDPTSPLAIGGWIR